MKQALFIGVSAGVMALAAPLAPASSPGAK